MSDVTFNENAKWGRKRDQRKELVRHIISTFGMVVTRKQLLSLVNANKCMYNDLTWIFVNKEFSAQRGQYSLACMIIEDASTPQQVTAEVSASV